MEMEKVSQEHELETRVPKVRKRKRAAVQGEEKEETVAEVEKKKCRKNDDRETEKVTETPTKKKKLREKHGEKATKKKVAQAEAEVQLSERQQQPEQENEKVSELQKKKRKEKEKMAETEAEVPKRKKLRKSEGEQEKEKVTETESGAEVPQKKRRKKKNERDTEAEVTAEKVRQSEPEQEKQKTEVFLQRKKRRKNGEEEMSKEKKQRKNEEEEKKVTVPDQPEGQDVPSTKRTKRKERLRLVDAEIEDPSTKLVKTDNLQHVDHVKHKRKKKKQDAVVQTETPTSTVPMEESDTKQKDEEVAELWSKLPPELEQRVLAKLPVEQIFAIQPTCRGFRKATVSSGFRWMWRRSERAEESTVLIRYRYPSRKSSRCYSSALGKWCNVPNSFFLPKDGFLPKDAKGGLVAARLEKKIGVGNPVTQEWVYIDPAQVPDWHKSPWTLIVPRRKAGSGFDFRLLVGDRFYDSRTGNWEQMNLPGDTAYGSIYCDGVSTFYYLCEDDGQVKLISGSMDDPRNFEVLRSWNPSEFKYPLYHQLVDYHGELGLISDSSPWLRGLSFHVFDVVTQSWIRKSQMPKEMSLRVLKEQGEKKKRRKEGGALTEREIWQLGTCGTGTGLSFVVPRGCSGFILFDARDTSWRWIDDPAPVVGMGRRSDLFCTELSL